jgi:hypothetical protein
MLDVLDGFPAITDDVQLVRNLVFLQGLAHQQDIAAVIFCEKYMK